MAKVVLSVLAHPDDAEFLCAGTLIRLRREHGFAVHIASMTAGDCGSVELPPLEISRLRRDEGAAAAAPDRRELPLHGGARPAHRLRRADAGEGHPVDAAGAAGHRANAQSRRLHGRSRDDQPRCPRRHVRGADPEFPGGARPRSADGAHSASVLLRRDRGEGRAGPRRAAELRDRHQRHAADQGRHARPPQQPAPGCSGITASISTSRR